MLNLHNWFYTVINFETKSNFSTVDKNKNLSLIKDYTHKFNQEKLSKNHLNKSLI